MQPIAPAEESKVPLNEEAKTSNIMSPASRPSADILTQTVQPAAESEKVS